MHRFIKVEPTDKRVDVSKICYAYAGVSKVKSMCSACVVEAESNAF